MDPRLLRHYETELAFLREMGAEFAQAHPKIASRLGMDGIEILDPYVERLLEGTAFLTARVQLELELQYPAFTSHLLDVVYPHYLAPTPSMMVAELTPDMENASLENGYVIKRGTTLRSGLVGGAQRPCQFKTGHDLKLWPVTVSEVEYINGRGELVAAGVAADPTARAGIRLRLARHADQPLRDLALDRLSLFIGGEPGIGWSLYEHLCARPTRVVARSTDRRADWSMPLTPTIEARGFSQDEALLPVPAASFDGYRLLQEFFAMPERYLFVEIAGLTPALQRAKGGTVDLYILLGEDLSDVAASITPEAFKLNCVPAVNLFERRCDRVQIKESNAEHHIVVDRTAPKDFEIHTIRHVTGISGEGKDDLPIRAFYAAGEGTAAGGAAPAYYAHARRLRQRSEHEQLRGQRTDYLGSESFLSLVDRRQAPYPGDLTQLAVTALVTNRDLPILLPSGVDDLFHLPDGGPVRRVRTPVQPTRPRPTLAQGDAAWRIIGHLSLNYLSIADDGDGSAGAAALRELIGLYTPLGERALERRLDGIDRVTSRPIVRRISDGVMSSAVRGTEVTLHVDEGLFDGGGLVVLGAVLDQFFRKHATLNSFTETILKSQQRGEIARWTPRTGLQRLI
jgi:type VI secretion system protein ImpG